MERDLTLRIRYIIRNKVDKAVIDSFQAMSLASAIDKDALVVETILDLMVAEVRALPNRETETMENLTPDDIRKYQHGLEDFICHQLRYMRKDRPRDQRQHTIQDALVEDSQRVVGGADPGVVLRRLLNQAAKL